MGTRGNPARAMAAAVPGILISLSPDVITRGKGCTLQWAGQWISGVRAMAFCRGVGCKAIRKNRRLIPSSPGSIRGADLAPARPKRPWTKQINWYTLRSFCFPQLGCCTWILKQGREEIWHGFFSVVTISGGCTNYCVCLFSYKWVILTFLQLIWLLTQTIWSTSFRSIQTFKKEIKKKKIYIYQNYSKTLWKQLSESLLT